MTLEVDLPEELIDLGAALGIVALSDPADAGTAGLNEEWFSDPGRYLAGVFAERTQRDALLRLASRQLGNPVGDLDLPDVPAGQQWVPLASTPTGGLYLVVEDENDDGAVLGLGARAATLTDPVMAATVHVPLLRAGGDHAGFVVGTAAGTISVGVSVSLEGGPTPGGVALDGTTLALTVPTDGSAPSFTIQLTGLRLDGSDQPKDILVTSDKAAGELLGTALTVLRSLVLDSAADSPLAHLLALLGIGGESELPSLSLDDLLAGGSGALVAWLRALAADVAGVRAWLGHLAGLLGLDPTAAVGGDGSSAAPLAVTAAAGAAEVAFTVALGSAADTGDPVLRPGLRLRMPAPGGFPGRAEATVELAEIQVGGGGITARPLPAGRVVAHLGPDVPLQPGVDPLVDTTVLDDTPISVGALEAGLALDGAGRPLLVLAAFGVNIGADTHPVVDLTMPDALFELAVDALGDIVGRLLETLGDSTEAAALLALLGLGRPTTLDPAAPWPHAAGLPAFFTDPLGAVARFHAEVLTDGDWGTLAGELAALLRGGDPPAAIAGTGSEADPWTVELAQDAVGAAALAVWGGGGTRLHLGVLLHPAPVPLAEGVELRAAVTAELLSLELTGDGAADALPGAVLGLAVGDELVVDLGTVALEVGSVTVDLRWRRGQALSLRVGVTDVVAVVGDTRVPLPIPAYDSAAGTPSLPDDFPWPVITRLLGDALLTRGVAWLEGLATLTGWDQGLPTVITDPPTTPIAELPGLPVERLPADPLGVVREWAAQLLTEVASVAAPQIAAWIGTVTAGAVPGGGPFGVEVGGGGTATDPYAVRFGSAADAAELLLWFEPDGTTLFGVAEVVLPPELTDPLDLLVGDPPEPEALAGLLREAARSVPELAPVVDGRPGLGDGLAQLRARLADSDGLVPAAAQQPAGATPDHTLDGLTHLEAPLGFDPDRHLPAGTDPAQVLYVVESLPGLAEWPHRGPAPLVDLTEPGLAPEALDLSAVTGPGPWFVRLATRAAAGDADRQAARLGRVVTAALGTLPASASLTVVAHGPAALAARRLAATPGSGVGQLVTLAAPLGGATFEFLDEPVVGDAARALQALVPLLPESARENPQVADGVALVDTLGTLLDTRPDAVLPVADYRLAGPVETLPPGVGVTTVTVAFAEQDVTRAVASLIRHAIAGTLDRLRSDRPADAIGTGVRVRLGTDEPAAGRIETRVDLRADLHRVRLRDTAAQLPLPRVVGHVQVRRTGGWLVGGPRSDHDPTVPREPRLRWAELSLVAEPGTGGMVVHSSLTLHEAAALGVGRPRWDIDLSGGGGLVEEARVLLGRLATVFAEADAGPTTGALTELFRALGLLAGDPSNPGFVVDAVERFLVDPAAAISARLDDPIAATSLLAALGALTGPSAHPGEDLAVSAGGLELGMRLTGERSLVLRAAPAGLPLAAGLALGGSVEVRADGLPRATLRLGPAGPIGPGGALALTLEVDPAAPAPATLALERVSTSGATAAAELFPTPETAALTDLLVRLLPAELVRLGVGFAAETAPAVVEPLLEALGLRAPGDPAGYLRYPAGLLADPIGWLRHETVLGSAAGPDGEAAQRLVDGLRTLLSVPGPAGTLQLPWGLVAEVGPAVTGGGVDLQVGWTDPQVAGAVDLSATVSLRLPAAGPPAATLSASIGLTAAPGTARVDLAVGAAPLLAVRVTPAGGPEIVLPIVPTGGAGGLAGTAEDVTALLPLVLDALTEAGAGGGAALEAIGPAVAALGDALGLRMATGFDAQALTELANDPAGELVRRIRASADGQAALGALAALVSPVLPTGTVVVDTVARTVRVAVAGSPLELSLSVPAAGTAQLCGTLTGFQPTDGLRLDAVVCVSPDGLRRLELHTEVIDDELLAVGGFSFFPFAAALFGPDAPGTGDRFEVGLWLAPPAAADRDALVLRLPVGATASVVCRPSTGPEHTDLVPCVEAAARSYVVPLLVDLVVGLDPVEAALDRNVPILGGTLGELLDGVVLIRPQPAGPFQLDPAALDPANLLERLLELGLRLAQQLTDELSPAALAPFTVSLFVDSSTADDRAGVRISAPPGQGLTLVDTGEVAIALEADTRWFVTPPRPADGGLTVLLVARDTNGVRLEPELRVEGLGLRVSSPSSDKLVDLGVTIRSLAAYAALDRRGTGGGEVARIGGQLQIDGLGVPLGNATGDNPVAGKILSSSSDSSQAGDSAELAPTFSPAVVLWEEGGELSVLVRAGAGAGPWWLPIQRSFGPIYVEQVGVGAEDAGGTTTAVQLLLDGGLQMLGLAVQVDDLSVTIPTASPLQPDTWRLGLAGLALGLDTSGLKIAGGLRERRRPTPPGSQPLPPDYVGMIRVEFGQYGINAIGGYGEFPDGAGGTYTSFFLFGALSAPLGGPPAFFVTGIGAGAGINRRLLVPSDMAQLPSFPLVAAMDPTSDLAADPMGALDLLGQVFPAERGTLWFAAGVRFTSFVVVESIAVLSAEVGDGLEINLLGLSRMDLPTPLTPMARIELALRARFSTREGVLSILAQLTDNSWIINESCRLTGGFAFVTFFRTGQFVLTLGGYHPRFAKPAEFPLVPRLGFVWQVSDIISVKGEAYFALTASCVMAGAKLDLSLDAGWIWGRLVVGFDALISWDPFHYLIHAYASVTVGFKIEICVPFLGCARIKFSMSIGADLEIEGPELRGKAKLDLDVTSFTVRFGATGAMTSSQGLVWHEFYEKYLVAGDEQRRVMDAVVTSGGLALPAGSQPDDGSAARPYKLLPEFVLTTSTRAASTAVNGVAVGGAAGLSLGAGPMKVARIDSNHTIAVRAADGSDRTAALQVTPVLGSVPAAVWESHDGPEPPAEAKVRPAATGATLTAQAHTVGAAVPLPVDDFDPPGPRHPLPFHQEQATRPPLEEVREEADQFDAEQPTATAEILRTAAGYLATGVFRPTALSTLERRVFAADRVGPPRLAPLTEGIVDPVKPPAAVADRPPPDPEPDPDTTVLPPVLEAQLRLLPPGSSAAAAATTVAPDRYGDRPLRRRVPPTLAEVRALVARTPVAARLVVGPPPAARGATPAAAAPTVVTAGATPRTLVAGGLAERRRGLLASQTEVEALADLTKRLPDGAPLRPGDVQVWRLPNSAADVAAEERRPGLTVEGDQLARVVALDRGGEVLLDRTGGELSVTVPLGTHRLVVAGLGAPAGGDATSGLAGWHAASMVAQVTPDVYLAPASLIRAEASRTVRARRTVGAALVRAGEAVAGAGSVVTRLPGGLSAVLLALDTEGAVDAALDGLVLGLEGAERAGAPLVVTAGDRVYAVFPLDPTVRRTDSITVTVGSDERWLLAGVVGSAGPARDLADRVVEGGLADRVAELVGGALGASVVRWSGG
jgi:hypothetical protein